MDTRQARRVVSGLLPAFARAMSIFIHSTGGVIHIRMRWRGGHTMSFFSLVRSPCFFPRLIVGECLCIVQAA